MIVQYVDFLLAVLWEAYSTYWWPLSFSIGVGTVAIRVQSYQSRMSWLGSFHYLGFAKRFLIPWSVVNFERRLEIWSDRQEYCAKIWANVRLSTVLSRVDTYRSGFRQRQLLRGESTLLTRVPHSKNTRPRLQLYFGWCELPKIRKCRL